MSTTIKNFPKRLFKLTETFYREVPSTVAAHRFVNSLVNLMFPIRDNKSVTIAQIEIRWEELQVELREIVTPLCCGDTAKSGELTDKFFSEVPLITTGAMQDAQLYHQCDPASFCVEEVVLCYPGFYAVLIHRIANVFYRLGISILPRVISEYAHSCTGIDIHPGATIGKRFYIDHGTGIVIGETAIIGNNVTLYQGVTLGAKFVDKTLSGVRRHPKIEDNVIIYAGSTILGGETVIGADSIIGGNVWLTESVPAGSTVYHRPEIVIKGSKK